mmetsp:Transcript_7140/g.6411  ORF Transcript_7140/g.6411 Transcript_7140/m.6411 type:complete len:330 (+) Transcript_7140:525-1514(+)
MVQDLTEAIKACDNAVKILEEIRDKDLSAEQQISAGAFIQSANKRLQPHLENLKEKISKINKNAQSSHMSSLMDVLVEVASSGVNQELVEQIIAMIRDLQFNLKAQLEARQQADVEDAEASAALLGSYQQTINEQTALANTLQGQIEDLDAQIGTIETSIDNQKGLINKTDAQMIQEEQSYTETSVSYKSTMERIRIDIEVLGYAINCLIGEGEDEACKNFPGENEPDCSATFYYDAYYNGGSETHSGSGALNAKNAVSSFKIDGNCSINLYDTQDGSGESHAYGNDVNWLDSYNDRVESFKLVSNTPCTLTLYQHYSFEGSSEVFNGD